MDGLNPSVIIAVLAVFVVIGVTWWMFTVLLAFNRPGRSGRAWLLTGMQFNLLLILFAWLVRPSGVLFAVLAPWYPPVALMFLGGDAFFGLVRVFLVPVLAGFAVMLLVGAAFFFVRKLRLFALGAGGLAGLLTIAAYVPIVAQDQIKARATDLGATCLATTSIWEARHYAGDVPQFNLHAVARINGTWHGWSYTTGDFYPFGDNMEIANMPLIADCKPIQE